MRKALTEKQQTIYAFIVSFIREHNYPPTIREIQKHFNYNSVNSVIIHLNNIEEKGYIIKSNNKDGQKARTLRLTDDLVGIHTIEIAQLKKALSNLSKNKGFNIDSHQAIELLSELKVKIV